MGIRGGGGLTGGGLGIGAGLGLDSLIRWQLVAVECRVGSEALGVILRESKASTLLPLLFLKSLYILKFFVCVRLILGGNSARSHFVRTTGVRVAK